MLSSLRKNGLTSLFKEVRVFKESRFPENPESRFFYLLWTNFWPTFRISENLLWPTFPVFNFSGFGACSRFVGSQSYQQQTKGAGRERGPQKSSRNFVSESGRFRVQISLWLLWKEQSTIFAPFWEKAFGAISGGPFFSWPLSLLLKLGENRSTTRKFRVKRKAPWGDA